MSLPIQVTLRDGRTVLLRWSVLEDAADLLQLQHVLAADGRGMVLLPEEVPDSAAPIRENLAGFLERPGDLSITAELDGVAVGSLDIARISRTMLRHNGYLTMGIHPDVQGVGLGRRMLEAAIAWARADGLVNLELNVVADNTRAIALYRSLEFEAVYRREGFLRRPDGTWGDDLQMLLKVSSNNA